MYPRTQPTVRHGLTYHMNVEPWRTGPTRCFWGAPKGYLIISLLCTVAATQHTFGMEGGRALLYKFQNLQTQRMGGLAKSG